jgi:hypothetical protein
MFRYFLLLLNGHVPALGNGAVSVNTPSDSPGTHDGSSSLSFKMETLEEFNGLHINQSTCYNTTPVQTTFMFEIWNVSNEIYAEHSLFFRLC